VSNLATGCVEYLADERRQASLDGFFSQFSADVRNGIEAVAMDMWDPRPPDPYITSTRQHLADADDKIVFDRYHLMAYLTKAVDTVRKQENRALVATSDKRYFWATPLSAPAGDRRGQVLEAPRSWPAVVLRSPPDQCRSGGHQLPHPGDPRRWARVS
jgi:transposase